MSNPSRKRKIWSDRVRSRDRTRSKQWRIGTRRWKRGQQYDPRQQPADST